jgi:serine/threonine-protein kinase
MGGMIVGTAAYMSPEQARGHAADQRSDVFAFGCLLFEMLTGQQAFQGEDVSDVLASVIKGNVDLRLLPANLNPRLNELLRRCLARDRKNRWHAIADIRLELETIIPDPRGERVLAAGRSERESLWKWILPIVAAIALTFATTTIFLRNSRPSPPPVVARFTVSLPEEQNFTNAGRHLIAVSPDGANVVYVANRRLYLRSMADTQIRPIPGSESDRGVTTPFFSPDGRWVGFYEAATQRLKKIAISGGPAITICNLRENPFGASWASDDQIFVGQGPEGIVRVSANGDGKSQTAVTVKSGESAHGPQLLSRDLLLFSLANGSSADRWDKAQIVVQSMRSGERKVLFEGGSDARYVPTGHIVFAVGSTLFAFSFDISKLRATSGPVPVLERVIRAGAGLTGAAQFGISSNGALVSIGGDFMSERLAVTVGTRTLALEDRTGTRNSVQLPPGLYDHPRVAPDGKQLAVTVFDETGQDIWIYDLTGAVSPRRLTFGGYNHDPVWTPTGERIVFFSERGADSGLFWQPADGKGPAEELVKAEPGKPLLPYSWSPDGKVLTYGIDPGSRNATIWAVSPGSGQPPKMLIEIPGGSATNSSFSPNGHWIAYGSADEKGHLQVYVQAFPVTGTRYQISSGGSNNHHPLWSPKGGQLFYVTDQGRGSITFGVEKIISVDIKTEPGFTWGKTMPLPIEQIVANGPRAYDITPDGKYFIVMQRSQADSTKVPREQINIALNWLEELKQKVPVH